MCSKFRVWFFSIWISLRISFPFSIIVHRIICLRPECFLFSVNSSLALPLVLHHRPSENWAVEFPSMSQKLGFSLFPVSSQIASHDAHYLKRHVLVMKFFFVYLYTRNSRNSWMCICIKEMCMEQHTECSHPQHTFSRQCETEGNSISCYFLWSLRAPYYNSGFFCYSVLFFNHNNYLIFCLYLGSEQNF